MTYALDYSLPANVQTEVDAIVALRRTNKKEFTQRLEAFFLIADEQGVRDQAEMELAIQLAWAAREWSKKRPIKTSWRGFSLGAAIVTDKWIYDAYNFKPLVDTDAEEHGYPKTRLCAEQLALIHANDADDINIKLLVLVGYHHEDGNGHMPKPCGACIRLFTSLPNHRELTVVLINSDTEERKLITLGEAIDTAELPAVECECCTITAEEDLDIAEKYPRLDR